MSFLEVGVAETDSTFVKSCDCVPKKRKPESKSTKLSKPPLPSEYELVGYLYNANVKNMAIYYISKDLEEFSFLQRVITSRNDVPTYISMKSVVIDKVYKNTNEEYIERHTEVDQVRPLTENFEEKKILMCLGTKFIQPYSNVLQKSLFDPKQTVTNNVDPLTFFNILKSRNTNIDIAELRAIVINNFCEVYEELGAKCGIGQNLYIMSAAEMLGIREFRSEEDTYPDIMFSHSCDLYMGKSQEKECIYPDKETYETHKAKVLEGYQKYISDANDSRSALFFAILGAIMELE